MIRRYRPRRLRRAARSLPEPPTTVFTPVAPAILPDYRPRHARRCPSCGRPIDAGLWCCWVCRHYGGHTAECDRAAWARDPRWYAGARRV